MTQEQKQVKDWMQAFGQECPEAPVIPSLEVRKLRAKIILEEALETIEALGFHMKTYAPSVDSGHLMISLSTLAIKCGNTFELEENKEEPNLIAIADGCSDLKVVTEGTLVACGLVKQDIKDRWTGLIDQAQRTDPLFDEVMRSNWSKMWTIEEYERANNNRGDYPVLINCSFKLYDNATKVIVKDSNGKIIKSPSYSPANLSPIIEEMSK